jgi:hypothetical protein
VCFEEDEKVYAVEDGWGIHLHPPFVRSFIHSIAAYPPV